MPCRPPRPHLSVGLHAAMGLTATLPGLPRSDLRLRRMASVQFRAWLASPALRLASPHSARPVASGWGRGHMVNIVGAERGVAVPEQGNLVRVRDRYWVVGSVLSPDPGDPVVYHAPSSWCRSMSRAAPTRSPCSGRWSRAPRYAHRRNCPTRPMASTTPRRVAGAHLGGRVDESLPPVALGRHEDRLHVQGDQPGAVQPQPHVAGTSHRPRLRIEPDTHHVEPCYRSRRHNLRRLELRKNARSEGQRPDGAGGVRRFAGGVRGAGDHDRGQYPARG